MKKIFVYCCDMCQEEVKFHLLPRYIVDDTLKEIVRRRGIDIEHLCEHCMCDLNTILSNAINFWKENKGRIEVIIKENTFNGLSPVINELNKRMINEIKAIANKNNE